MIKRPWLLALIAMALMGACQFLSDGGTEIPNELTGNLYLQGGGAAVNAQVTLYPTDFLPGNDPGGIKSVHTDAGGHFVFPNVAAGRYNLIGRFGAHDSLLCFLDSLSVSGKVKAPSDTLKRPGSLTGTIQLDTNDNPATATVQVVGTDYFGLVDSNGIFTLRNIPEGDYQLRVVTTLPDYAPATKPVTVQSGRNDTLTGITLAGSTVALWTFDATSTDNHIADLTGNGFHLTPSKAASFEPSPLGNSVSLNAGGPVFSTANNIALTIGATGLLTYEARLYLGQYPAAGNFNAEGFVMGMHEGLKLLIGSDGSLIAGTQKQALGGAYFYAPASAPGIVPLNRWVEVAVAIDEGKKQCYGYIDGVAVPLTINFVNADPFQVSTSLFTVGNDSKDSQPFIGKIDEMRVFNSLIKGAGLPLTLK